MAGTFKEWTVLPHGKVTRIDDDLLTVVGNLPMPMGEFPRRMTVARLRDGRLVVFSAIALHEDEMRALEAFGQPAFLVIPGELHRMDAKTWKARYPGMVVVAPAGAREKVSEVVAVDRTEMDFGDPRVRLITVPGTADHELALLVRTPSGTTLIVNDVIWNVDDRPGLGGWIYKAIGATKHQPQIPAVVKMRMIKDKVALRKQLEEWARTEDVNRIIVSHGDIVSHDARKVLVHLAHSLAA